MSSLLQLMPLVLLILGAAFWWTSARARERAVTAARHFCHRHQLQLLDHTVAMQRLRPARDQQGQRCFRRVYHFEYTQAGEFRDRGTVTMLGARCENIELPYLRDASGARVFPDRQAPATATEPGNRNGGGNPPVLH